MKVYCVGQLLSKRKRTNWQIIGVFSIKEKALEVCRTENHFIGPLTLDHDLGDNLVSWEGAYYPLIENDPLIEKGE